MRVYLKSAGWRLPMAEGETVREIRRDEIPNERGQSAREWVHLSGRAGGDRGVGNAGVAGNAAVGEIDGGCACEDLC